MRIAYLDCSTGISGDMTLSALVDAGVDPDAIVRGVKSLQLPDVELTFSKVMKGGFSATQARITHPEQHAHRHYSDIVTLIDQASEITAEQAHLAKEIFLAVATAEATVHGSTIEKVHFHEVGAIDSIVDIVGVAIGFDLLGCERVVCSRIPTGQGQISIDHGICTVPAPGTAELLKGIPLQHIPVEAELTTPTGAAIVSTLVDRFGALPEMTIESIGYGAGTMTFPSRANLLRLFVGTAVSSPTTDLVNLLETNLDDVSGEVVGHTKQQLLAAGALDVFSTPVQMKKDRPGSVLSVLTRPEDRERLESIIFKETGTLGIRRHTLERTIRGRQQSVVQTPYGPVSGKLVTGAGLPGEFVPEYEDCAKLAAEHGVTFRQVYRIAIASSVNNATTTDSHSTEDRGATPADHDHRHDGRSHDHDHDDHHHDH